MTLDGIKPPQNVLDGARHHGDDVSLVDLHDVDGVSAINLDHSPRQRQIVDDQTVLVQYLPNDYISLLVRLAKANTQAVADAKTVIWEFYLSKLANLHILHDGWQCTRLGAHQIGVALHQLLCNKAVMRVFLFERKDVLKPHRRYVGEQ